LDDRPELAEIVEAGKVHLFDDDANGEHQHRDTYDEIMDLPTGHSCLVAPLHIEGKILGLLTLDHRACNVFTPQIVRTTETLARIIALSLAQSMAADVLLTEREALVHERNTLLADLPNTLDGLIGHAPNWLEVLEKIRMVAPTDTPVMILGDTGTGKEQLARALHALSSRAHRSFVALNCSALVSTLAESELFGHERGAFTGAVSRRRGRFELANNGTLFLDEIGEMPLDIQPKLLRALQEQTFERVGGEIPIKSDARLICATNTDLEKAVREGRFREDLFYRLNVFPIHIPPLRERGEDVILLANHFLSKLASRFGKPRFVLSKNAIQYLLSYRWPGNVRELQNTLERAAILCKGASIELEHLEVNVRNRREQSSLSRKSAGTPKAISPLDEAIRDHIIEALGYCKGRIYGPKGAAAILGLKPTTLQSKMRKLGIDKGKHYQDFV
jgi:transcriptional regulator with GAF, ATPase, and Fis domain